MMIVIKLRNQLNDFSYSGTKAVTDKSLPQPKYRGQQTEGIVSLFIFVS